MRKSSIYIVIIIVGVLNGCGKQHPPELLQAANVIHYMLRPINLSHSVFSAAFSTPTPSQFVSYIFSPMGIAEWPDNTDPELMRSIRAPIPPPDVHFTANKIDWNKHKQIVVTYDNSRSIIIVNAYLQPHLPPVFQKQWKFKAVSPAPGVAEIYRANVELGYSMQSF